MDHQQRSELVAHWSNYLNTQDSKSNGESISRLGRVVLVNFVDIFARNLLDLGENIA